MIARLDREGGDEQFLYYILQEINIAITQTGPNFNPRIIFIVVELTNVSWAQQ